MCMEILEKDTNNNVACCILSILRKWSVRSMHLFFLFIYIYISNSHGHTLLNEKRVPHSQGHISILKYLMWCHQKCALSIHPSKLKNLLDSSCLTQTESAELNMAKNEA